MGGAIDAGRSSPTACAAADSPPCAPSRTGTPSASWPSDATLFVLGIEIRIPLGMLIAARRSGAGSVERPLQIRVERRIWHVVGESFQEDREPWNESSSIRHGGA